MDSFDWQQYILNYPELSHFTKEMAQRHFKKFGQFENRTDKKNHEKIMITVITPCSRPHNLLKLKDSLNFDYICEWIIVYDISKVQCDLQFEEFDKISEYRYTLPEGKYGYPQRNYALSLVNNKESYIYFLDDDNIIHPDLYTLSLLPGKIYTFNQLHKDNNLDSKNLNNNLDSKNLKILYGGNIKVGKIDIAMYMIYYPLLKDLQFGVDKYHGDGQFIVDCYNLNKHTWIYVNKILCYYNFIF